MEVDWEQEVEESVERKALVQLSRLLEEADRKSREEEQNKEKAAEGKVKRLSKKEKLRPDAAKTSKKITSFFAKQVSPEVGGEGENKKSPLVPRQY